MGVDAAKPPLLPGLPLTGGVWDGTDCGRGARPISTSKAETFGLELGSIMSYCGWCALRMLVSCKAAHKARERGIVRYDSKLTARCLAHDWQPYEARYDHGLIMI